MIPASDISAAHNLARQNAAGKLAAVLGGSASTLASLGADALLPAAQAAAKAVYATGGAQALAPADIGAEASANKNAANGYAGIGAGSRIADAQAPLGSLYKSGGAQAIRLDELAVPTASVSLNSQKITSLGTPTADGDAATKIYVDGIAQGLRVKDSVRLATAAELPANTRTGSVLTASANGALSVDSVAVANADRILVKDQAGVDAEENGFYVVTDLGSAGTPWILTRSDDASTAAELAEGSFCWVKSGSINANTRWAVSTEPVTLNTDDVLFSQISGAAEVTAGAGLVKSGNDIATAAGNGSIVVNADSIQVGFNDAGGDPIVVDVGAASDGTAVEPSRRDHKHAHGAIASGDLHAEYIQASGARALTGDLKSAGRRLGVPAVKTADYTLALSDDGALFDAAAAARVATLPAATGSGRRVFVGKTDSSANTVTIDGAGAETINGAATKVLNAQYEVYTLVDYAAGAWIIIG